LIQYDAGPLLIAAGPGTGKTEVLVARCLKFMCCDAVAPVADHLEVGQTSQYKGVGTNPV
jgi:hypothetical protein